MEERKLRRRPGGHWRIQKIVEKVVGFFSRSSEVTGNRALAAARGAGPPRPYINGRQVETKQTIGERTKLEEVTSEYKILAKNLDGFVCIADFSLLGDGAYLLRLGKGLPDRLMHKGA